MVIMSCLPAIGSWLIPAIIYVITTIVKRNVLRLLKPSPSCPSALASFSSSTPPEPSRSPLLWCKVKDGLRLTHERHLHRRIEKSCGRRRQARDHFHHRQSDRQVLRNPRHPRHDPRHGPPPD